MGINFFVETSPLILELYLVGPESHPGLRLLTTGVLSSTNPVPLSSLRLCPTGLLKWISDLLYFGLKKQEICKILTYCELDKHHQFTKDSTPAVDFHSGCLLLLGERQGARRVLRRMVLDDPTPSNPSSLGLGSLYRVLTSEKGPCV